ncbi:hypothetical protein LTR36_005620 [Oleoguttula mirabilis]|uniref:PEHE domain-containing protein n=1 Tax=Oleoguttula mirabilis TaxID=1507867 RepID=A0AAV9JE40_9PEZI|nr:hypothetical protein LTR36_005620 [Oleoguttula mirabilis]
MTFLHWRTARDHETHFSRLLHLSSRKKRKNKGKQPIRLDSNAATGTSAFPGYTVFSQNVDGVCEPDAVDDTNRCNAIKVIDFAYTAPPAGEAGPSNWSGRPETPSEASSLVIPSDDDGVEALGAMEVDPHLLPDLDVSTLRSDNTPFYKRDSQIRREMEQKRLNDEFAEGELRAITARWEALGRDLDLMKPSDRAKLKPRPISDEGFYRGYSPWRELGDEDRATERSVIERILEQFSWPKALKRPRAAIEEPVSPRSRPQTPRVGLDLQLPKPKCRRKLSAMPERKVMHEACVQVEEVEDEDDNEDGESGDNGHDQGVGRGSYFSIPPTALQVMVAKPAQPEGASSTASSPPHDSARQSASPDSKHLSTAMRRNSYMAT